MYAYSLFELLILSEAKLVCLRDLPSAPVVLRSINLTHYVCGYYYYHRVKVAENLNDCFEELYTMYTDTAGGRGVNVRRKEPASTYYVLPIPCHCLKGLSSV